MRMKAGGVKATSHIVREILRDRRNINVSKLNNFPSTRCLHMSIQACTVNLHKLI